MSVPKLPTISYLDEISNAQMHRPLHITGQERRRSAAVVVLSASAAITLVENVIVIGALWSDEHLALCGGEDGDVPPFLSGGVK